jgi:glutamine cyclotransferase
MCQVKTVRADVFTLIQIPTRLTLVFALLAGGAANAAPTYSYKVIATYPHSTESYTEGFLYLDGIFYEGIGIKGRSAVLAVAPETGRTLQRHDLPPEFFGEGIVDWGPNIY